MNHPHEMATPVPHRVDAALLRSLSQLSPARALAAIAFEWSIIATAITTATLVDAWPVTALAVLVIGARQHALTVISHDATHFRLLRSRRANDWVANLLLAWPMFISVQGFRHFHGDHHRFLGEKGDGNRELWHTHDANDLLTPEWRYTKTLPQLVWKVLRRVAMLTGAFWILRGLVGGFMYGVTPAQHVARIVLLATVAIVLTWTDAWLGFAIFWVLPYITWHVAAQYIRLVCEHSAVHSDDPRYGVTRTTIPGPLGRAFVLPRNIGYHLEHHWYPSVPFYNLPALHEHLVGTPQYTAHARFTHSILASLAQCTTR